MIAYKNKSTKGFPKTLLKLLFLSINLVILSSGLATEIALDTPSGGTIRGLLVKKSSNQIEVQTAHGIIEIKERDITTPSWIKAQRSVVSRPKKLKNDQFIPKPRQPKEIRVSSASQEDKSMPVPYTGFLNNQEQEIESDPEEYKTSSRAGYQTSPSILYQTAPEDNIWKLESQIPQLPNYETINIDLSRPELFTKEVIQNSKNDAIKVFFPLTIVALSLVLLAKSTLQLKTKIISYVILGFLLLSIALENTLFGMLAISALCILMLAVEILSARRHAIQDALNLTNSQKTNTIQEAKTPDTKTLNITPYMLSRLEWKKFEEFCCLWLEHSGFEITGAKTGGSHSANREIEGSCPPKTELASKAENSPSKQRFRAICRNWDAPITIKDVKELKRYCTGTEIPIIMTVAEFNPEVLAWAKDDKVRLVSNKEITKMFKAFPTNIRSKIISEIWDGQQEIPTCPVCIQKMTSKKEHTNSYGNYKTDIWYCKNYKTCHQRLVAKNPKIIKVDKIYKDFSKSNS